MAKHKKKDVSVIARRLQRKLAISQGFYDGRYKEKTVKDKKKEANKLWARRGKNESDDQK
ncbi:MAG: hypothetical protein ACKOQ6_01535 [Bacteroidota bacterium]